MIGKLAARDSRSRRHIDLKSTKAKEENKIEVAMIDAVMINEVIKNRYRPDSGDRRQYRQGRSRPRFEHNYRGGNFRGKVRTHQNFGRQNSRGKCRNNYRL